MNTYLAIITTALVVTQIIRLIQNTIQLYRQNVLFKKQLGQIEDVTQEDLDTQRKAYRLAVEYLKHRVQFKATDAEIVTVEDECNDEDWGS